MTLFKNSCFLSYVMIQVTGSKSGPLIDATKYIYANSYECCKENAAHGFQVLILLSQYKKKKRKKIDKYACANNQIRGLFGAYSPNCQRI